VREQRGGVLPLRALLSARLGGIQITDLPRFFERVHGRVPIDSLKASWLIYGKGFRQTWLRGFVKRGFDILVTAVCCPWRSQSYCGHGFLISLDGGRRSTLQAGESVAAARDSRCSSAEA
jgi:hypothetical protein